MENKRSLWKNLYQVFLLILSPVVLAENIELAALSIPVPAENPLTEQKRVLGKILFWDEQLSSDNSVACGSCHKPSFGGAEENPTAHPGADQIFGTDDDVMGSKGIRQYSDEMLPQENPHFGFSEQVTGRSSPSNINAMFADSLFWDGRATGNFVDPENTGIVVIESNGALESQALGPILSSVEMAKSGRTWTEVINKLIQVEPLTLASDLPEDIQTVLLQNSDYASLFNQAFGDSEITPVRIAMAIASYQRTLVPDQSPWDKYVAGDTLAMTDAQIAGWDFFEQSTVCDNCHVPPLFTDNQFYNIGLRPAEEDIGRQEATDNSNDYGSFKTPTLRNLGLRKSLMHTGGITDARDAIDFYNATADEENNIDNRHQQFTENQSAIPTTNPNVFVDYHTLSMASESEQTKNNVADFIANGLTDPRVAQQEFPFDRPTLGSERKQTSSTNLSFMTYNISGANWQTMRAELIAELIETYQPAIIGLQEAGTTPQGDLSTLLGNQYQFIDFNGSATPIVFDQNKLNLIVASSTAQDEMLWCVNDRYINYAIFADKTTGSQFIFLNTHFCSAVTQTNNLPEGLTAEQVNQQHAETLAKFTENLITGWQLPVVIAGDLNANINSNSLQFLLGQAELPNGVSNNINLTDSWSAANGGNKSGIDWLLYSSENNVVQSAEVIESDLSDQASDHYPVIATIAFNTDTNDSGSQDDGGSQDDDDTSEDNSDTEDSTVIEETTPPTEDNAVQTESSAGSSGGSFSWLLSLLVLLSVLNSSFANIRFWNNYR